MLRRLTLIILYFPNAFQSYLRSWCNYFTRCVPFFYFAGGCIDNIIFNMIFITRFDFRLSFIIYRLMKLQWDEAAARRRTEALLAMAEDDEHSNRREANGVCCLPFFVFLLLLVCVKMKAQSPMPKMVFWIVKAKVRCNKWGSVSHLYSAEALLT